MEETLASPKMKFNFLKSLKKISKRPNGIIQLKDSIPKENKKLLEIFIWKICYGFTTLSIEIELKNNFRIEIWNLTLQTLSFTLNRNQR